MHPPSTTTSRFVPSRATVHCLVAAVLLPLSACVGLEGTDELEVAPAELGSHRAALSADDTSDVAASDVAPSALTPASSLPDSVNPYLRIQAYREKKRQAAAAASARSSSDSSEASFAAAALLAGDDTLVDYAAKCDAATGIHVPAFNCNNGTEIPQGVIQTTLTNSNIGITGGTRVANVSVNTINAAGADIWNNADQFFFAHTTGLPGGQPGGEPGGVDGYAEVLVTSLANTHAFAKAGVMFRASTAAGAVNIMLAITPTSGVMLQKRTTTNGTSTNEIVATQTVPKWLRLVRRTNTFRGFVSTDRVTWTQVGSAVTLTGFTTTPLVGLAVTSHNAGVQTQAVFDNFSWTPFSAFATCDQPNALHQSCDPGSRFQILAQNAEATVVANCRKQSVAATTTANQFGDIAVIQYNKENGAICFYQAYSVANANAMPAPSSGNGPWLAPDETHAGGCTGCHDSGSFIKSRYLTQLNAFPSTPNVIPSFEEGYSNDHVPLRYVGSDFADDRSWSIDTDPAPGDSGSCNGCHRLGVNNVIYGYGTAAHLAPLATAFQFGFGWKTPHSAVSPIWMRPGQVVYDSFAEATAWNFSTCATRFWAEDGQPIPDPGFTAGNDPADECFYQPLGSAWFPFADAVDYTDVNIGITGGTRTPNGTVQVVNAAGADIFGTSDQFLFSYKLAQGDGQATVKVTGLTNTNPFAKAGIMFRHTNAANAVNAMIGMTPTSGAHFQYRNAVGGSTTSFSLAGHSNPRWLKMARSGRSFVGYVSTDQAQWTQVGSPITLPAASFSENSLAQFGLAVTSHNASTQTQATFDHLSWLPAAPDTLVDANIGITNGTHAFRAGKHTIAAGGADIFGTSDQFFYAFQTHSGTGNIVARVTSIGNSDPFAKAGVMFRSSAAANSANVMMEITAGQGAGFQYRTTAGGNTTSQHFSGHNAPKYVRLERAAGGVFKGYVSSDGVNWGSPLATVTIASFPSPALVGLAVTSHNTGATTTATFTDVVLP